MEITFLRHGESLANLEGRWQGHGDTPLTSRGKRQVQAAARRLQAWGFDRIISSDLDRAKHTAAALDMPFEPDPSWREVDIGAWEGLTREEVAASFGDQLEALAAGQDVAMGGGESMSEFRGRLAEAFDRLVEAADPGQRLLVVAHGGVISAVAASVVGLEPSRRRVLGRSTNASLTTVWVADRGRQLLRYNDAAHLGVLTGWAAERVREGDTVITLVRHAESEANLEGRWQGLSDGLLSEAGERQVAALAGWYGELEVIYASRLRRALETARGLGGRRGVVNQHPGVHEMAMGEWEDLTEKQIREGWADLWGRIYGEGEDLPRGASGEAFWKVAERMRGALAELASRHAGARFGVVSHGGAIRAFLADLLGLDHGTRHRLALPFNASVTHVVVGEESLTLADFNLAPHVT